MDKILERWNRELGTSTISIKQFIQKTIKDKVIESSDAMTVAGYTIFDSLDGKIDDTKLTPVVQNSLSHVKNLQDTNVKEHLEKLQNKGASSLLGLTNKVKGELAEQYVLEHDSTLKQATVINEEAWDLFQDSSAGTEYIQIKSYKDASGVLSEMQDVYEKLLEGKIEGINGEKVENITWGVSDNIFEELSLEKIKDKFGFEVFPIGITNDEITQIVGNDFQHTIDSNNFFENFGLPLFTMSLESGKNAYLYRTNRKDAKKAIQDTVTRSLISTLAVQGSFIAETVALELCIPLIAPIAGIGGAILTRAFIKSGQLRFTSAEVMEFDNKRLASYLEKYSSAIPQV